MCFDTLIAQSRALDLFADKLLAGGYNDSAILASIEAVEYLSAALSSEDNRIHSINNDYRDIRLVVDNTKARIYE
jgi:hypothetical protein